MGRADRDFHSIKQHVIRYLTVVATIVGPVAGGTSCRNTGNFCPAMRSWHWSREAKKANRNDE
jgi:hypothetical protein